ncbi:hypothetical protein ISO99_07345 [Staphylococcus sp. 18_1_E_LY]|uniref:Uncharacterized protein n=1 Tax=Staphylococcus lloydii TaxID=2781774 RepID=A0A7T1F9M1_9STAP|nr:hypothetical protein [Staphylococcus lloydii]MBF7019725.1 hypothetical protein [Staphylococcus lloydii]MBF7027453.1 hypothetical protein [Staphylococcus lloydii]QPM75113.1 hypothetical protein ISP08_12480 [Staphylococcus lloydii]
MNPVIFKYDNITQQIETMLRSFHSWLKDYYITTKPVLVTFTKDTLYVNDCVEDTIVFEDSHKILYSLNDIEDYRLPESYYSKSITADDNVVLTVLYDICRELAIFYIADRRQQNYGEIVQFDRDEQTIAFLQQMMMYQYYFLNYKPTESAITISYTRQVDKSLKKTLKLCTQYIKEQFDFPMPVDIKISTTDYDFAGQFSAPHSPFDKALIKVTAKDFQYLLGELGRYDAELNICRILLHEVLHYQIWVESQWFIDVEAEEQQVEELEEKHINLFIDRYM